MFIETWEQTGVNNSSLICCNKKLGCCRRNRNWICQIKINLFHRKCNSNRHFRCNRNHISEISHLWRLFTRNERHGFVWRDSHDRNWQRCWYTHKQHVETECIVYLHGCIHCDTRLPATCYQGMHSHVCTRLSVLQVSLSVVSRSPTETVAHRSFWQSNDIMTETYYMLITRYLRMRT